MKINEMCRSCDVKKMADEELAQISDAFKVEEKRRRGRPRLRRVDCIKRDLETVEENGERQQEIEGVGENAIRGK